MSLKTKILTLVIIPSVVSIYFFSLEVKEGVDLISQAHQIEEVSNLSVHLSALVHELQRERGQTSGFLGSNGSLFEEEVLLQHTVTERKIDELNDFIKTFSPTEYGTPFTVAYRNAFSTLSDLESHRTAALSRSITGKENIDFYTTLIAKLLKVVSQISYLSFDPQIAPTIAAYDNFLKGKEYTGIERALGTNTFALGKFEPGNYEYFVSVIMKQDIHFSLFLDFADLEETALFRQRQSDVAFTETALLRRILIDRSSTGDFNVDSRQWYDLMTQRINLLKEVENKISTDLITKASTIKSEAVRDLISFLTIVLSTFLALFIFGLTITMRMLKSIQLIRKGTETVSSGNFDFRIGMSGKDELSQLATSFDLMTDKVRQSKEDLEKLSNDLALQVEEKTTELQAKVEELENSNKFMIGREIRMIELKKQVSDCKASGDSSST